MVAACIALALILLLRFGPDVPFLRVLRVVTVEMPARRLPQLERHQIIAFMIIAAIILAGGKLIVAFAPDLVALFATNLGIYFDGIAISALLGATSIVHRATRIIRIELVQRRFFVSRTLRGAVREVRTRPVVTKSAADNNDEPAGQVLGWAA